MNQINEEERMLIEKSLLPYLSKADLIFPIEFLKDHKIKVGKKCFQYFLTDHQKVLFLELYKRNNKEFWVFSVLNKPSKKRKVVSKKGKVGKSYLSLLAATVTTFTLVTTGVNVTSHFMEASAAEKEYEMALETDSLAKENPEFLPTIQLNTLEEIIPSSEELTSEEKVEEPEISKFYDVPCSQEYQQLIYELCVENGHVPFRVAMAIGHIESGGEWNNVGKVSKTNDYGAFQINSYNFKELRKAFGYQETTEDQERFRNDILYNQEFNARCAIYLMGEWFKSIEPSHYEEMFGKYNGWTNWRQKSVSRAYAQKGLELLDTVYVPLEFDETLPHGLKV